MSSAAPQVLTPAAVGTPLLVRVPGLGVPATVTSGRWTDMLGSIGGDQFLAPPTVVPALEVGTVVTAEHVTAAVAYMARVLQAKIQSSTLVTDLELTQAFITAVQTTLEYLGIGPSRQVAIVAFNKRLEAVEAQLGINKQ